MKIEHKSITINVNIPKADETRTWRPYSGLVGTRQAMQV
jgi:hypothetical protein